MPEIKDIVTPFRVALGGLVHTVRTQRHMRVHIFVTIFIILASLVLNLRVREILILLFMINFVLVSEMFNSAIEAVVDLVSPNYHPLAKFAKDISAGAVLVTTIMAVTIGAVIIIGDNTFDKIRVAVTSDTPGLPPVIRLGLGAFVLLLVVIIGKGLGKRGTILKGGLVSGHAAFSFFIAGSVLWLTESPLTMALCILLAIIVAQSRWEAKIHSFGELALGGIVGLLMSLLVFGLQPK